MNREELLNVLRDHYEESIFVTDGYGIVVFANQIAAQRLHCAIEDLIGRNVEDLVSEGVYSQSTTLEAIRTGRTSSGPVTYEEYGVTYSNSVPVFDDAGELVYVVTNNMSVEHQGEWDNIINSTRTEADRLRLERDYLRLKDQRVIIAYSKEMRHILSMVEAISPTDSNVVILGESGTGKDMLASLIHEKSRRSQNAFISINCAAIPDQLLESELFGYEGGAFTGALSGGKIGLFEATSGGTLFLDEIGEMSLSLQSKLLRVLENREVRRVGGVKNIPVDVRIICATNRDLSELVAEKKFREDLYYRLSVFTISIPPLRERKEDILPIAENILQQLNERYNKHKQLSGIAKETMLRYGWPGNIRELRNVIERIFVISAGNELDFTPTPTAIIGGSDEGGLSYFNVDAYDDLKSYMDDAERRYIEHILEKCGGSVAEASEMLGIHRSALYRKLKKL